MRHFIKQPFFIVCFLEFFERFAFYGFLYISIYFYIDKLNFTEAQATNLMGGFSALTYSFNAFGGVIADRILGIKRTMFLGAIILASGYLVLAFCSIFNHALIYMALALIIIGSCLFKPAPTNLIAQSYALNKQSLDGVFTYFYMVINMGSFFASLIVPFLTKNFNYSLAISVCGLGLVCGTIYNVINYARIKAIDNTVGHQPISFKKIWIFCLLLVVVLGVITFMLSQDRLINILLIMASIVVFGYFIYEIICTKDKVSRQKMIVAFILLFYGVVFFVIYQQKSTSFLLFNKHHVDLVLWGFQINPQTVPGVLNTVGIILLSPLITKFYTRLGKNLALPQKFSLGLMLSSSAYGLLYFVCLFTNPLDKINFVWEIVSITILFSASELLISALGVSLMAQLVPERLRGFSMGMWFVASALGIKLGSYIASLAANKNNSKLGDILTGSAKIVSFNMYKALYGKIFFIGVLTSIVAWMVSKKLKQML